ncbi:MAG: hypothetical protein FWG90_00845 [Oscillospiraceae bacterium]|nr:hypothetical protein [Oscillospiraceae bacterium]
MSGNLGVFKRVSKINENNAVAASPITALNRRNIINWIIMNLAPNKCLTMGERSGGEIIIGLRRG